jgi:hypothetical protein
MFDKFLRIRWVRGLIVFLLAGYISCWLTHDGCVDDATHRLEALPGWKSPLVEKPVHGISSFPFHLRVHYDLCSSNQCDVGDIHYICLFGIPLQIHHSKLTVMR